MRKLAFSVLIFFFVLVNQLVAQEISCSVKVNSDQIEGSEKTVFQALEQALNEFVNNRKWTDDEFEPTERIECSILLNLKEQVAQGVFSGSLQIQTRRPVFNSTYTTTLINYNDKDLQFKYLQFDILDFSETAHLSAITSIIAFYVYMTLATDYDSFSPLGGTELYRKAQQIVTNAQSASEAGWKANESQFNRYWMVENMLDKRFEDYRMCLYEYHRLGLDQMYTNAEKGRTAITEAVKKLQKVNKIIPNSLNVRMFFTSKNAELINIYKKANSNEKSEIIALLSALDPANANKYLGIN